MQSSETAYEIETVDSPEQIHARKENAARVARALARLSEEQSIVVRLSFIEERAHGEIASFLGIPWLCLEKRACLRMSA